VWEAKEIVQSLPLCWPQLQPNERLKSKVHESKNYYYSRTARERKEIFKRNKKSNPATWHFVATPKFQSVALPINPSVVFVSVSVLSQCKEEKYTRKKLSFTISFLQEEKSKKSKRAAEKKHKGCYIDNDNQTVDKKVNISEESDYKNREEVSENKKIIKVSLLLLLTTNKWWSAIVGPVESGSDMETTTTTSSTTATMAGAAGADMRSKPLLSPTRSVDEGFESDPDRISTDSELTAQTPAFDILQRTDKNGVHHTQICLDSDKLEGHKPTVATQVSNAIDTSKAKVTIPRAGQNKPMASANNPMATASATSAAVVLAGSGKSDQRYRRMKTKAPPPPAGLTRPQHRSQSVDGIRNLARLSNTGNMMSTMDLTNAGDVLSGQFVRVTVDPRHHHRLFHTAQVPGMIASNSNLYALYHASSTHNSNNSKMYSSLPPQLHQYPSVAAAASALNYGYTMKSGSQSHKAGGNSNSISSNSQHQSYSNQMPAVCWTQSIPRQARR
jgi:hypothetical protein